MPAVFLPSDGAVHQHLVPVTLTGIIIVTALSTPYAANARHPKNKGQVAAKVSTEKWGSVGQRRQGQEKGSFQGSSPGKLHISELISYRSKKSLHRVEIKYKCH